MESHRGDGGAGSCPPRWSARATARFRTTATLAAGLIVGVGGGCGQSRPPTFGELAGLPAAEEEKPAARPVRVQDADHDAPPAAPSPAEEPPPKTLAEVAARLVPGSKETDNTKLRTVIDHPEAPLNIVDLNLRDTSVTDEGCRGIERLVSLNTLDVVGTPVTGTTLTRLGSLPALRSLKAGQATREFGTPPLIPPGAFPQLRALELIGVEAKGDVATFIRQLKGLTELRLSGCGLKNPDLACIRPLVNLEVLDISRNAIDDEAMVFVADHPKLWSLNLAFTQVQGPGLALLARTGQLQELKHLDLGHLSLTDAFAEALLKLEGLEGLSLAQTTCTDKGLTLLRSMRGLKILNLAQCPGIVGPGLPLLRELPELEELSLDLNPQIGDSALVLFTAMKGLKRLGLTGTGCTPLGVERLRDYLPNCQVVFLEEQ